MSEPLDDQDEKVFVQGSWVNMDDLFKVDYEDRHRHWYRDVIGEFPRPTPGQLLYERWCGSQRSDQARYWHSMNPAEAKAWEDLAEDIIDGDPDVFERVVRNLPEYRR